MRTRLGEKTLGTLGGTPDLLQFSHPAVVSGPHSERQEKSPCASRRERGKGIIFIFFKWQNILFFLTRLSTDLGGWKCPTPAASSHPVPLKGEKNTSEVHSLSPRFSTRVGPAHRAAEGPPPGHLATTPQRACLPQCLLPSMSCPPFNTNYSKAYSKAKSTLWRN